MDNKLAQFKEIRDPKDYEKEELNKKPMFSMRYMKKSGWSGLKMCFTSSIGAQYPQETG